MGPPLRHRDRDGTTTNASPVNSPMKPDRGPHPRSGRRRRNLEHGKPGSTSSHEHSPADRPTPIRALLGDRLSRDPDTSQLELLLHSRMRQEETAAVTAVPAGGRTAGDGGPRGDRPAAGAACGFSDSPPRASDGCTAIAWQCQARPGLNSGISDWSAGQILPVSGERSIDRLARQSRVDAVNSLLDPIRPSNSAICKLGVCVRFAPFCHPNIDLIRARRGNCACRA